MCGLDVFMFYLLVVVIPVIPVIPVSSSYLFRSEHPGFRSDYEASVAAVTLIARRIADEVVSPFVSFSDVSASNLLFAYAANPDVELTQSSLASLPELHPPAQSSLESFQDHLPEVHPPEAAISVGAIWKQYLEGSPSPFAVHINDQDAVRLESIRPQGNPYLNGTSIPVVKKVTLAEGVEVAVIAIDRRAYEVDAEECTDVVRRLILKMWMDPQIVAIEADQKAIPMIPEKTDVLMMQDDYTEDYTAQTPSNTDFITTDTRKPNDLYYEEVWGLKNAVNGIDIDAETAWTRTTGSGKTVIAILDTGIAYRHPDLKDNIWINDKEFFGQRNVDDDGDGVVDNRYGCNFDYDPPNGNVADTHGHGTHVAGIIGATGNNIRGIAGVNWHVSLITIVASTISACTRAFGWMVDNGIKVSNNSYKFLHRSVVLTSALRSAGEKGHLAIFAAGNDYTDLNERPSGVWPQLDAPTLPFIINVANIMASGSLAPSSNRGGKFVHVAAPGTNILSTYICDEEFGYKNLTGTSMATPFVTGIIGLLLSLFPHLTAKELRDSIFHGVNSDIPTTADLIRDVRYPGIIDALKSLTVAIAPGKRG